MFNVIVFWTFQINRSIRMQLPDSTQQVNFNLKLLLKMLRQGKSMLQRFCLLVVL